jgi:hypothetical protein
LREKICVYGKENSGFIESFSSESNAENGSSNARCAQEMSTCMTRDGRDFNLEVLRLALLAAFPRQSTPAAPVP